MATGISPEIYSDLRSTLLSLPQFSRHETLRAIFVDKRLAPWRNEIQEGANAADRVNLTIDYLSQRYDSKTDKNALVLLLKVLSDQIDIRDSCHQDLTKLANALERELIRQPTMLIKGKLVYDLQKEQDFSEWSQMSTDGGHSERIGIFTRKHDGAFTYQIRALSTESVGINKSLRWIFGRAEFEYQVLYAGKDNSHVYFCMIPMQETNIGRTGLIEVGSNVQADSKNPFSPYRRRYFVPVDHYGDEQWHQASISFDFREIKSAFYSIFAPRINEGCLNPKPAFLLTAKLRIFSLE